MTTKWGDVNEEPAGKFRSVLAINEPLDIPDDTPLRDILPGAWPTMGDLRRLVEAWNKKPKLVLTPKASHDERTVAGD